MLERARNVLRMIIAHPHYKVLAVLLALSTWWFVIASDPDQMTVTVPVDVTEPANRRVTGIPAGITVVLEGPRSALRRIDADRLVLPIDVSLITTEIGDHSLDLGAYPIEGLPGTVAPTEMRPQTLTFSLDEVDERSVPVEPVVVGEPAEGWMVVQVRLEPAVVSVRGPRRVLSGLSRVPTLPIDVSGLRFDRRFDTRPDLSEGLEVVEDTVIEARVDVEPKVETRVFSKVPVFVRGRPGRVAEWVAEPVTVRVRAEGPAASLRQISARDVVAQVYLPDEPSQPSYEASFAATAGVRAEVILASELVEVVEVEPSMIKVSRR